VGRRLGDVQRRPALSTAVEIISWHNERKEVMFTSIDKALVALVMGVLFIIQTFTGFNLSWLTEAQITTVIGLLTPVLVWAIPNKTIQ
jgi:membrane-associated HD superfamily phosphohydrolase